PQQAPGTHAPDGASSGSGAGGTKATGGAGEEGAVCPNAEPPVRRMTKIMAMPHCSHFLMSLSPAIRPSLQREWRRTAQSVTPGISSRRLYGSRRFFSAIQVFRAYSF